MHQYVFIVGCQVILQVLVLRRLVEVNTEAEKAGEGAIVLTRSQKPNLATTSDNLSLGTLVGLVHDSIGRSHAVSHHAPLTISATSVGGITMEATAT